MSQIEKRGEKWRARIRRFGFPHLTKTFKTYEAARRWSSEVEVDMERGTFLDRSIAEKTLFSDLLHRYANEVSSRKRSSSSEVMRLRAIARLPMGDLAVSGVTSQTIASFRDQRLKQVSASTVLRDLRVLAHVFEVGMSEWGINLPRNPVRLVRKPKPNAARDRRLTEDEETRLFAVLSGPARCENGHFSSGVTRNRNLHSICVLALETAMRQAEIVHLLWENIDLEKRTARLPMTKTGLRRIVPLSTKAVTTLRELQPQPKGSVFPGLTPEAVKRSFRRAAAFAMIEDFRFHDLRHEATSRLFEQGLSVVEVAAITGHRTLQMLHRYTHLRAEEIAKKLA